MVEHKMESSCPKCGGEVEQEDLYCWSCGSSLIESMEKSSYHQDASYVETLELEEGAVEASSPVKSSGQVSRLPYGRIAGIGVFVTGFVLIAIFMFPQMTADIAVSLASIPGDIGVGILEMVSDISTSITEIPPWVIVLLLLVAGFVFAALVYSGWANRRRRKRS
jgi:uncharacterized membrane protein (DUF485 family)